MEIYKIHELASKLPEMSVEEFETLKESIKVNGLLQDIILWESKVLDGRHRYKACQELDVKPKFREYTGSTPVAYVIAQNVNRRHLTPSQRAVLAVELLPDIEAEAASRKAASLKQNAKKTNVLPIASNEANGEPTEQESKGKSASIAAKLLDVSTTSVERAKRAKDEVPEKWEAIKNGTETVSGVLATKKLEYKLDQESPETYKGVNSAATLIELATKTHKLKHDEKTKSLLKLNTRPCSIEIIEASKGYTIVIGNAHAFISYDDADRIVAVLEP
jgi:ParB-like chromosome segregation protein Spo0J